MKVTSTVSMLPPLMEFLGGVAVVGADLVRQPARSRAGGMTQGDFVAFVVAAFMMYGPIKKLSRVNANLQQAIAASERIFELLDTHSEVIERRRSGGAARRCRAASSSATSASSTKTARPGTCLRDVSFSVEAGQVIAHRRPERRRQDDARQSASRASST